MNAGEVLTAPQKAQKFSEISRFDVRRTNESRRYNGGVLSTPRL